MQSGVQVLVGIYDLITLAGTGTRKKWSRDILCSIVLIPVPVPVPETVSVIKQFRLPKVAKDRPCITTATTAPRASTAPTAPTAV